MDAATLRTALDRILGLAETGAIWAGRPEIKAFLVELQGAVDTPGGVEALVSAFQAIRNATATGL